MQQLLCGNGAENPGKGLLQADDSAAHVVGMVGRLDASTSGTFWAADTGEVLPW